MRRPNPWVAVPSLAAGLIAGALGWIVTEVSCRPEGCLGWTVFIAVSAFVVGTVGMAVVVVLVIRSLAEYRDATSRGESPPGPGCEV